MDREEFEKLIEPLKRLDKYKIYRMVEFSTGKPLIDNWSIYNKENGALLLTSTNDKTIEDLEAFIEEEVKKYGE